MAIFIDYQTKLKMKSRLNHRLLSTLSRYKQVSKNNYIIPNLVISERKHLINKSKGKIIFTLNFCYFCKVD